MLSYPVASLIMGNQSAALFTFVVPFLVSTCGGTVLAAVTTVSMAKMGVLAKLQNGEGVSYTHLGLDVWHRRLPVWGLPGSDGDFYFRCRRS